MDKTKGKILKEKIKDEEGGIALLCRLTKLNFLPKFYLLDVQVLYFGFSINGYFKDGFFI